MTLALKKPELHRIGQSACNDVLGTLFSPRATALDSSSHRGLSRASDLVTSSIALTGPGLSGSVAVQLPRAFVLRVVRVLTGLDGAAAEASELLDDAAGEFANMVAGRVAIALASDGYPCTLGIPSVFHGSAPAHELQPGEDHDRTELICEGDRLSLELRCRFAKS